VQINVRSHSKTLIGSKVQKGERSKGNKDRMVPLPDKTLQALRILWSKHRHPRLLFPGARGSMKTVGLATTHMNIGGTQNAMKTVVRECNIKKNAQFL